MALFSLLKSSVLSLFEDDAEAYALKDKILLPKRPVVMLSPNITKLRGAEYAKGERY